MPNSFFEKVLQKGATVVEDVAPIAGTVIGGVFGGPAGAAAGAKLGKAVSSGVAKAATHIPGGVDTGNKHGPASFTPSSAGSIPEARAQDKARMSDQYGIDPRD